MQGLQSLNEFKNFVSKIGGLGRYEDTYIVHAAEGETVVPMEVLDKNPLLKKRLFKTMMAMGIEPGRYIVGNDLNSKNPVTGQPEFFLKQIGRRLRKAAADISGYAAPIAGAMFGPVPGALVGGLLGQYKRENPGDPTQGMQMALRGGLTGLGTNIATGQGYTPFGGARGLYMKDLTGASSFNPVELGRRMLGVGARPTGDSAFGLDEFLKTGGEDSKYRFMDKYFPSADTSPIGDLEAFNTEYNSILNSEAGRKAILDHGQKEGAAIIREMAKTATKTKGQSLIGGMNFKDMLGLYAAGTIGLGALLDMTTDEQDVGLPEDEMPEGNVIDLNPIAVFPGAQTRADGGIMDLQDGGESKGPGTGTSDSIPAMLSDGEFVMTAEAVRGAGGGDRREGAKKMYEAMDKLEARA
jgi:hypothetical protein